VVFTWRCVTCPRLRGVADSILRCSSPIMAKNISDLARMERFSWSKIKKRVGEFFKPKKVPAEPDAEVNKPPEPWRELTALLNSYNGPEAAPEVLYFGDSVLMRVAYEDEDAGNLGELVAANLRPLYKTCGIYHSAYTPRIFYHLSRVLEVTAHQPKLVILPINMRCFSPQWDLQPLWQFNWEIEAIDAFLADPQGPVPLKIPDTPRDHGAQEFGNLQVNYVGTSLDRIQQFLAVIATKPTSEAGKRERWKTIFTYHYLYKLNPDHRTLRRLKETVVLLNSLGIKVLIYLTPINYQGGKNYVGALFEQTLAANVALIKQALADVGGAPGDIFLGDWTRLVDAQGFFHDSDPTEHLNRRGRKSLADAIGAAVQEMIGAGTAAG
jgi:hypothetical protein